ncbi:MAG: MBL fold metallo-hydrolase [Thermoproteota archaeon]
MKVRWLGNACLEIFGEEQHLLVDPNFLREPNKDPDLILLTHEHDDHYNPEGCADIISETPVYAPQTSLKKFDLDGVPVKAGDNIDGIQVKKSWCWNSQESVSYFYKGLLHAGDSAQFPQVEGIKLVFTACFPDYYEDYITAFKRLKPELVIPFHYDVPEGLDDAKGLKKKLDQADINCKLLKIGEKVSV